MLCVMLKESLDQCKAPVLLLLSYRISRITMFIQCSLDNIIGARTSIHNVDSEGLMFTWRIGIGKGAVDGILHKRYSGAVDVLERCCRGISDKPGSCTSR